MAPILETAISLVFIYVLFSLIVSWLNEIIISVRGVRGKFLRQKLSEAFDDRFNQKNWAEMLYVHPSIDMLARRDAKPPTYIPSNLFANGLVDIIISEAKTINFTQEEGSLSFKPIESWIHTTADSTPIEKFNAGLSTLRDSDTKALLVSILNNSKGDFEVLKTNIAVWYEDYMDRVTGWYKRSVRWYLFLIGLIVAIVANVNSLHLLNKLYHNTQLRASTLKAVDDFIVSHPNGLEDNEVEIGSTDDTSVNELMVRVEKIDSLYAEIEALNLPIGWTSTNNLGDSNFSEWIFAPLGWLITAFALSFGAPFWFDVLKKFVNMRSTGLKPPKAATTLPLQR